MITKNNVLNILLSIMLWLTVPALLCSCGQDYPIKNLVKTDIDLVTDVHIHQIMELLKDLTVKLYKRNPGELKKSAQQSIEKRLGQIFEAQGQLRFKELDYRADTEAILLCFDEDFQGDRVFALMTGLVDMIRKSYNYQNEFFVIDSLDQQKLYNSARNIEIMAWRLSNKKDASGQLFLLSNGLQEEAVNLSFERLFGKLIAIQDLLAEITADRTNRTISRVVHSLASATFLPIGL